MGRSYPGLVRILSWWQHWLLWWRLRWTWAHPMVRNSGLLRARYFWRLFPCPKGIYTGTAASSLPSSRWPDLRHSLTSFSVCPTMWSMPSWFPLFCPYRKIKVLTSSHSLLFVTYLAALKSISMTKSIEALLMFASARALTMHVLSLRLHSCSFPYMFTSVYSPYAPINTIVSATVYLFS